MSINSNTIIIGNATYNIKRYFVGTKTAKELIKDSIIYHVQNIKIEVNKDSNKIHSR